MTEPIEERYFNWLYSKVASTIAPTPSLRFVNLFRIMHSYEFVWLVVGDDNRAEDGVDLRYEFLDETQGVGDSLWLSLNCSVLEMLIAFSRKCDFTTDIKASEWFWTMLRHLGVAELTDAYPRIERRVLDAMERLVWRTYKPSGRGGLFPLRRYPHDQTQVEIWYQFNAYLDDQRE